MAPGQSPFEVWCSAKRSSVKLGLLCRLWKRSLEGAHPENPDLEDDSPAPRVGWQRPASSRLERQYASEMWPVFNQTERALMLSQSGPMCGEPFTCFPSTKETQLISSCLHLPLPLTARRCRCGRLLDSNGYHRAACARVGVLGRRGFALETAAARVCREAGGRVMTNMLVRELDLAPGLNTTDGRRLEVIADGLSLFQGVQLAIDHIGVGSARRRHSSPSCSHDTRCSSGRCEITKGDHLSRARWRGFPGQVGRLGCRSRRTLVCGDGTVPWCVGGIQSTVSARDYASVGGSRLAAPLEKDVGLQCGESLRKFSARAPLSCLCCR